MIIFSKTDPGKIRHNNQDSYAAAEFVGNAAMAVVCDGMGGANGGNIASAAAVKIISDSVTSNFNTNLSDKSIRNILNSAINNANTAVFRQSRENSDLKGMGTTVVTVVINAGVAHIAHAGDSRAYLYKDNELVQITRDHSIVQNMIESGEISKEEARIHPNKNVITRAIGVDERIDFDYNEINFSDNDIILICTDGLTNYVGTDTIKRIIGSTELSQVPEKLILLANNAGGGDNITVVVMSPGKQQ